ncbi:hypothetical protein GCM10011583_42060 [Streptomyces camponoticapitis]|uniref:Uncharacterized protein n=1 Tax=Streptomyces camponoticapitis TaxID=1616125 RepID=A0ABQ2EBZ2_9ACTN|nr:hypothetical protein [Streptomyces camponoticapitis]GGK05987.1 hypothetical protein GCM10011583_42060 [Streptomyces camponoticapitis]
MAGDTPSRKRRFRRGDAPETHRSGSGPAEGTTPAAEHSALLPHPGASGDHGRGLQASLAAAQGDQDGPVTGVRRLGKVRRGIQKGGASAKAGLAHLADRIIDNAPRVPVRDLATLRKQFPGLGPEELADKLVAGAANSSSTVGAGIGAVAMMPVPPAMPAELAAEITAVAAIELKLIAELHEVYGLRPPGNLKQRSTAYLTAWTEERGVDITKPATLNSALTGRMKRELRQQIMKRTIRSLPNLVPFMIGAAVGAMMNRRDTQKVAERIRKDLRARQISWDALPALPPLEQPKVLPPELPKELGH